MTTVSSPRPPLDAADVTDLAAAVAGPVLLPGNPAFAEEVGVPGAVRSVIDALHSWSTGSGLLNFLGSAVPERLRALWGEPDRTRLCAVKRRYDPDNVFGFGQDLTD